jgi:hypothetical protein
MLKVVFQVSAMELNSRLDLTEIFCPKGYRFAYDVDDFYRSFEQYCHSIPQLTAIAGEKRCPKGYRFAYRSRMSLSEVMTIVIAFHGSGYRTFKEFYTLQVKPHWHKARQRGLGGFPHERLS